MDWGLPLKAPGPHPAQKVGICIKQSLRLFPLFCRLTRCWGLNGAYYSDPHPPFQETYKIAVERARLFAPKIFIRKSAFKEALSPSVQPWLPEACLAFRGLRVHGEGLRIERFAYMV